MADAPLKSLVLFWLWGCGRPRPHANTLSWGCGRPRPHGTTLYRGDAGVLARTGKLSTVGMRRPRPHGKTLYRGDAGVLARTDLPIERPSLIRPFQLVFRSESA